MCHEVRAISALELVRTIDEVEDIEMVRMFTALTTGPGVVFSCSCSDSLNAGSKNPTSAALNRFL